MQAPKITFLADLLEEHLEEIAVLWERRTASLRSPDATPRTLEEIDGRTAAHVDGIAVAGAPGLALAAGLLASEDPALAYAGAHVLLRIGDDAQRTGVVDAFLRADAKPRGGLREALRSAPLGPLANALADALPTAPPPLAADVAEVLASHGRLDPASPEIPKLLASGDPLVRRAGWRVVALVDAAAEAR